jgi:hypothetical protein
MASELRSTIIKVDSKEYCVVSTIAIREALQRVQKESLREKLSEYTPKGTNYLFEVKAISGLIIGLTFFREFPPIFRVRLGAT